MATGPDEALDAIHHVALAVEDVERAVAWYTANFRCRLLSRDSHGALLQFANLTVALVEPRHYPALISLVCPAAEEFGELRPRPGGGRSALISDSEGNALEVIDSEQPSD